MIPVNEPKIGENEIKYALQCLQSGWISSESPWVDKFETAFAEYIGVSHAVAVSNGTAALEVALYALGVGKGDEVILPSFTIISCALAVLRLGATPVLVDIDTKTWNMNVAQVASRITAKTKAVLAVHIYGHPVEMKSLLALAESHAIPILEDCAQAHGAEYRGKKCGSMGSVAAFSFYANKLLTTGEGGMVLMNSPQLAARAKSYRNLCFNKQERFLHDDIGYNFRLSGLQAAVGLGQLERLDNIVVRKREMGRRYVEQLSKIAGLQCQIEMPWAKTVYWMYCVQLSANLGYKAKQVMARLKEKGIATRPFFKGLHAQPALQKLGLFNDNKHDFPNTDNAYEYGFYLPSGLTLTNESIDEVCLQLQKILS